MHIPYVSFYGRNGGELLPTDAARVLDLEVDRLHVLPQVGTASEGADEAGAGGIGAAEPLVLVIIIVVIIGHHWTFLHSQLSRVCISELMKEIFLSFTVSSALRIPISPCRSSESLQQLPVRA